MSDRPKRTAKQRIARWRYVVPNAITCVGLLIGLTSSFYSMAGDHVEAAWLIVLCVLIDKADGSAARLLRATSQIGMQLDSFSDFVTFGIAPGVLILTYVWSNPDGLFEVWQGPWAAWVLRGLVATYVLCACIRLAKFNVLTEVTGHIDCFFGMPTTFCGAFLSTGFVVAAEYQLYDLLRWSPVLVAFFGALMVSNLPLPKVAKRKSKVLNLFQNTNIAIGYVFGVARLYPEYLVSLVILYFVGGFAWGFLHRERLNQYRLDPYPQ